MRVRVAACSIALAMAACGPATGGSESSLARSTPEARGQAPSSAAPASPSTSSDTLEPGGPGTPAQGARPPSPTRAEPTPVPPAEAPAPETQPEAAAPAPERTSRWQPAMLTIDDVPAGWDEVRDDEADEHAGTDQDDRDDGDGRRGPDIRICNQADFAAGAEFEEADDVAGAVFRAALWGPYVTSIAATLPSGQVEQLLTAIDRAGRSCRTWVQVDEDGNEAIFTIEPIEADQVAATAEQATAFRIGVTANGLSFDFDLLLWRFGDTAGAVIHAGTVGSVDRDATVRYGDLVSARMAALVG